MQYKTKLVSIRHFILDVDGVLTDGTVLINGEHYQRMILAKDSYALQYAVKQGLSFFIITGGESTFIKDTYEKLGASKVILNAHNKLSAFSGICNEFSINPEECLYMGDDMPDIPVMKTVGCATCPSDACTDVREVANYVSPFAGGKGCVRDVIEQTLRVQQKWALENAFSW